MKSNDSLYKFTDFISDYQDILICEFNSSIIQKSYNEQTYSFPVKAQLFNALKIIADSKNKSIREKKFTIFMGDFGSAFELFGIGIKSKITTKITDIISSCLNEVKGYETMEYGRIPFVPLIPCYRFESGIIVEYTSNTEIIGKMGMDEEFGTGLEIIYRMWESAEGLGMKEK